MRTAERDLVALVGAAGVDPSAHTPHPLHGQGTTWPQTNCALDLWIEVLGLLGLPPDAAGACAFSAGCSGDHWVMLKYPTEDLRRLYGIDAVEFGPWKPTLEHVQDHLALGHLMAVDVDTWWLPNTAGTSYRSKHGKTSIVPLRVDAAAARLVYLHNDGLFELGGQDFAGVFATTPGLSQVPLPYVELIRAVEPPPDESTRHLVARDLLHTHLARRPVDNPVGTITPVLLETAARLPEVGEDYFHAISFATARQLGSTAQVGAGFARWLATAPDAPRGELLAAAAEALDEVAAAAIRVQFLLARASRGRSVALEPLLDGAAASWQRAIDAIVGWDECSGSVRLERPDHR